MGAPRKPRQWYETEEGRCRLQLEMAAIERFNAGRREDLRLVGRRERSGHLALDFAFAPLPGRPLVVRGELMVSSRHPDFEPAARITSPDLQVGRHLIYGEALRAIALARTIPDAWARKGPVLCMFEHNGGRDAWGPHMTLVTAVLNVQSWFLNYLYYDQTGHWPYDGSAA